MKHKKLAGIFLLPLFYCCSVHAESEVECKDTSIRVDQPWKLKYKFGGSAMPGTGEISLVLENSGKATVKTEFHGKNPTIKKYDVPKSEMQKLAKVLIDNPISCIKTIKRDGYIVFDVGHTSIKFDGNISSLAYYDECHYVENSKYFGAVVEAIQSLEPYIGKEIKWFSGMASSVKSNACSSVP